MEDGGLDSAPEIDRWGRRGTGGGRERERGRAPDGGAFLRRGGSRQPDGRGERAPGCECEKSECYHVVADAGTPSGYVGRRSLKDEDRAVRNSDVYSCIPIGGRERTCR